MRLSVEIKNAAGVQYARLTPGQRITIGRTPAADVVVTSDPLLSNVHLALSWDGQTCEAHDLGSKFGTIVRGRRIDTQSLQPGESLLAGRTQISLTVEGQATTEAPGPETPAATTSRPVTGEPPPALDPRKRRVLRLLGERPGMRFALLDAARSPAVLKLITSCPDVSQSLYEGERGEELAAFAPYLMELAPGDRSLAAILKEGWGRSWGVFLTSDETFANVRKHLRRFLTVRNVDGKQVYFRFHDPRVLRRFLPVCTGPELGDFFGPITDFWQEGASPDQVLHFSLARRGGESALQARTIHLAGEG